MSIEAAIAELTAAVNANTAILQKLEAGREAALAQLQEKGEKPASRSRRKPEEPAAGNAAGDATGGSAAASPPASPSPADAGSTGPTATEDEVRQVATNYIKGAGDNAENRKARADNIKSITDHFGTAALAGDNGIKDPEQRAQAVFYLKRFDAGLEVNFSAEYDFTGDPTQGAAEAEDSFDGIG
jgi:hypothetical protein